MCVLSGSLLVIISIVALLKPARIGLKNAEAVHERLGNTVPHLEAPLPKSRKSPVFGIVMLVTVIELDWVVS